jgi:hypothetical protein
MVTRNTTQKIEMQGLRTSCFLLILCCCAAHRLAEETIQFVEDYFTHKYVRVITGFASSKYGKET